jgi:hypothetical protein
MEHWQGTWCGTLFIYGNSPEPSMTLPMVLEIGSLTFGDTAVNMPWVIRYDTTTPRNYVLRYAPKRGAWVFETDEQNGIVLTDYRMGNALVSAFEVMGSRLVAKYELLGPDSMEFEIYTFGSTGRSTGGTETNPTVEDSIPLVYDFRVSNYQSAVLRRNP